MFCILVWLDTKCFRWPQHSSFPEGFFLIFLLDVSYHIIKRGYQKESLRKIADNFEYKEKTRLKSDENSR